MSSDKRQKTLKTGNLPHGSESNKEKETETTETSPPSLSGSSDKYYHQEDGVTKIEALYMVFGRGWKLYLLWGSIALVAYVYSLQSSTTGAYLQFATSTFESHALLGTIQTINMILAAVVKPLYAKLCDMSSRPTALTFGLTFFTIGYIVVAASQSVKDLAGGQVLYTIGNTGLNFVKSVIVADLTSLQNRGLVNGLVTAPFIPNGFIAGFITQGINGFQGEGWRWGYGMFVIMTPILMAPSIIVLYWGQWRAKKLGALAIADPGYAQRQALSGNSPRKLVVAILIGLFWQIDVVGLLLLAFGLGCFLVPFSLAAGADGGYSNPSMIALLVVGFILLVSFAAYEWKLAPYPIMPRRIANRALICACVIDFFYFFSYYVNGIYQSSWVWVVTDWSQRDYAFWANTINTSICTFGIVAGLVQRFTHRYKAPQLFGLVIRVVGMSMSFAATYKPYTALLVISPILVGMGAAFSTIGSTLAAQASVPHADLAIAAAVLSLITSIGGSCGGAVAASIWSEKLPAALGRIESLNATEVMNVYGSIQVARLAEPRDEIIRAYLDTAWYMELPALLIALIPIIAGCLTTNFYLGTSHNAIETGKGVTMRDSEEVAEEKVRARVAAAEEAARAKAASKREIMA